MPPVQRRRRKPAAAPTGPSRLDEALQEVRAVYLSDPKVFLFGNETYKGLVLTQDEHDKTAPVKPIPPRPHLLQLCDLWVASSQLIVMKSRQMMLTWGVGSLILWEAWTPGQRWLVSCKKFDDADEILNRIMGIHERTPEFLRPKAVKKEGLITFQHGNVKSFIQAAAQDSEAARSRTYSGIYIDEASYTDNVGKMITASKPTTMAGGKVVMVTTPNGKDAIYNILTDNGRLEL